MFIGKEGLPIGNHKKELTPDRIEKRKKTAQRVRAYRDNSGGLTQEQLAELIGVTPQTISRYARGQVDMSQRVATQLQRLTGFPAEYWMGASDAKSREALLEEQRLESWVSETAAQLDTAYNDHWSEIQTAFSVCGYRLELDWKATAEAREKESGDPATGYKVPTIVRKVIDQDDPEHWFHCEESEIRDILNSLKETIGFWGYKKSLGTKSK